MESEIKFVSLVDQLHKYLSDSIVHGKIKAGAKLIENELSSKFGISRSPLRECFRLLESEGLVEIHPRKGSYVKELTIKDIEDVFPVRASLESLAARLAVPNLTENEMGILGDLIVKMDYAFINKEVKSFLNLNYSFHSVYIKASNNQVLERTLKNLGRGLWLRIAFLYYQTPKGLDSSNNMHKEIFRAFQEKDARGAERLIEEHIDHAKLQLIKQIKEERQFLG